MTAWSEQGRADSEQRRAAILWALVVGLLAVYLVLFALKAAERLARPLDELTYGESWLLDGARQVARGGGLYAPADQLPLMQIAYMPIYYVFVGALQRVLGDSGYTLGRAVSIIASLVGALALAWSVRRITGLWRFGLLAAALMLTQNVTLLLWGAMERVDALALCLTLVGLALFTGERPYLAALVFVLAFFTKQTFVAAPLAAAIALWPAKQVLVRYSGIVIGCIAAVVLAAEWLTHGWFWWHVATANANQTDLNTFATLMGSFLQFNGLPVLGALASLSLPEAKGERVWRVYFVASLFTLFSLAKLGASSNYWLETTVAAPVLLALATQRLASLRGLRLVPPTILAGALLISVPAYQATAAEISETAGELLAPGPGPGSDAGPRYVSLISDSGPEPLRVDTAFVDFVAHDPGELLTDNSGLAAAADKPITFEFQIFQLLHDEGYWSEQPIVDAIDARRFSLVALMHPLDGPIQNTRWSPAIQAALQANYVAAGSQAGFWLYRPLPGA